MPPLEDDIKGNMDLITAVGGTGGGIVTLFLLLKSAIFKSKKIDSEEIALTSYDTLFKTINTQVEHVTSQYEELLIKHEDLSNKYKQLLRKYNEQSVSLKSISKRLEEEERDFHVFREKTVEHMGEIKKLLVEREELIKRNIGLYKENLKLRHQVEIHKGAIN